MMILEQSDHARGLWKNQASAYARWGGWVMICVMLGGCSQAQRIKDAITTTGEERAQAQSIESPSQAEADVIPAPEAVIDEANQPDTASVPAPASAPAESGEDDRGAPKPKAAGLASVYDHGTLASPDPPDLEAEEILNATEIVLEGLLGKPVFVRKDGAGQFWRYEHEACFLDVYLFDTAGNARVRFFEARGAGGVGDADPVLCLKQLGHRFWLASRDAAKG